MAGLLNVAVTLPYATGLQGFFPLTACVAVSVLSVLVTQALAWTAGAFLLARRRVDIGSLCFASASFFVVTGVCLPLWFYAPPGDAIRVLQVLLIMVYGLGAVFAGPLAYLAATRWGAVRSAATRGATSSIRPAIPGT